MADDRNYDKHPKRTIKVHEGDPQAEPFYQEESQFGYLSRVTIETELGRFTFMAQQDGTILATFKGENIDVTRIAAVPHGGNSVFLSSFPDRD